VNNWLKLTDNSIASYAPFALYAITTARDSSKQHHQLAEASYNQFQAELCYKAYVKQLERCSFKDKKCMKAYKPLEKQCATFAQRAYSLTSGRTPEF